MRYTVAKTQPKITNFEEYSEYIVLVLELNKQITIGFKLEYTYRLVEIHSESLSTQIVTVDDNRLRWFIKEKFVLGI